MVADSPAPQPEVFHTNEGHAGFLGLERISELVGRGPDVRRGAAGGAGRTVFTTHTPVPAGIDRFDASLIELYFGGARPSACRSTLLRPRRRELRGRLPGMFNMAVMGLRLAQRANGVSQLHGEVSREMFDGLWPGFDADEVPITSVTNGVHAPDLDRPQGLRAGPHPAPTCDELDTQAVVGVRRWSAGACGLQRELRHQLVEDARRRTRAAWLERGRVAAELGWIDEVLDPDVLTIGFARRVPTYKRLTLMLHDPERLHAAAAAPRASGADRHRRQVAPGRR